MVDSVGCHDLEPWLDALQKLIPPVETAFLSAFERETRSDALQSLARGEAELARLRALEQDVRWGTKSMDAEALDRLRQYLAGRGELVAGDQLVLRHLREKARERQRLLLGLPLLMLGGAAFVYLVRREARERAGAPGGSVQR